jgi:hypothetical protein
MNALRTVSLLAATRSSSAVTFQQMVTFQQIKSFITDVASTRAGTQTIWSSSPTRINAQDALQARPSAVGPNGVRTCRACNAANQQAFRERHARRNL